MSPTAASWAAALDINEEVLATQATAVFKGQVRLPKQQLNRTKQNPK